MKKVVLLLIWVLWMNQSGNGWVRWAMFDREDYCVATRLLFEGADKMANNKNIQMLCLPEGVKPGAKI